MKKFPKFILTFSFLFFPFLVLAVQLQSPIQSASIYEVCHSILRWLFYVSIPLVALIAIWAGFSFMKSGGEPEKIRKAREILLYTVIGFAVILLSNGIVSWVGDILGVKIEQVSQGPESGSVYTFREGTFDGKDLLPFGAEAFPLPPSK